MTLSLFYDIEMGDLANGEFISGEKNGFLPACHHMIGSNTCGFARYCGQKQLRDKQFLTYHHHNLRHLNSKVVLT